MYEKAIHPQLLEVLLLEVLGHLCFLFFYMLWSNQKQEILITQEVMTLALG